MAPAGLPARVLSFRPLTFIGQISYGLYLWHWPIFLVLDHARTGLEDWSLFLLRLAVTFVVAVPSWYLVETPVRQMTFGSWRSWAWVPVGAAAAAGILFVTTSVSGARRRQRPATPRPSTPSWPPTRTAPSRPPATRSGSWWSATPCR